MRTPVFTQEADEMICALIEDTFEEIAREREIKEAVRLALREQEQCAIAKAAAKREWIVTGLFVAACLVVAAACAFWGNPFNGVRTQ